MLCVVTKEAWASAAPRHRRRRRSPTRRGRHRVPRSPAPPPPAPCLREFARGVLGGSSAGCRRTRRRPAAVYTVVGRPAATTVARVRERENEKRTVSLLLCGCAWAQVGHVRLSGHPEPLPNLRQVWGCVRTNMTFCSFKGYRWEMILGAKYPYPQIRHLG